MTAHARALRLLDLPLLALHSQRVHPNQAVTLARLAAGGAARPPWVELVASGLRLANGRAIWISREGSTLLGVAGLRRRGARQAWEIDHLITTTANEAFLLDLLDRVVATAGADGAYRLFLRLAEDSPALDPALRHGFSLVSGETLFSGPAASPAREGVASRDGSEARRRQRSDDHALFGLHANAVNHEVRWLTALSPAEWRAALDPLGRGGEEWVLPGADNASVDALVRLCHGHGYASATILSEDARADEAVRLAQRRAAKDGALRLLLPDGAIALKRAAETAGLRPAGGFQLLVRPIAQRAHRLQLAESAVKGSARPVIQ